MNGVGLLEVGAGTTPVEGAVPAGATGARVVATAAGVEAGAVGVNTDVVVETGVWVVNGPLVTVIVWLGVAV